MELTLYPLDTVKTRLMAATCAPGGFAGPLWAGLYAGAGTSTVGAVLQTGCFFGTYEPMRRWMQVRVWGACRGAFAQPGAEMFLGVGLAPTALASDQTTNDSQ